MTLSQKLKENETKKTENQAPHLIIEARAGTGKTTTLIEGLNLIRGTAPFLINPSPQQRVIWESMFLSKDAKTVCFVAFNKAIAEELKQRVPEGCNACTMHSLGFSAIRKAFGSKLKVSGWRVTDIIGEILGKDPKEIQKKQPNLMNATKKLVSLCKMNLVDPLQTRYFGKGGTGADVSYPMTDELSQLASHYDVDLNGDEREVFELVPKVLERCKDVARDGKIDFDDMVWLPIALGLPVDTYDLLLVDEAQDLNRCQQALAKQAGRRLIFCGDPCQAIYGFAGADSESMNRLKEELGDSEVGCEVLPLTVTYRCGKAIVAEANKIVPDFHAHESNGEGSVIEYTLEPAENSRYSAYEADYRTHVKEGDMILCRVNAPLVSECFKFIKTGRRANIQGRDVGQGLIATIKKLKATDLPELWEKLSDWLHKEQEKENRKRNPSDTRLIALQDRYDCLDCFMEDATTINEVIKKIENIFTDDKNTGCILLSSVHKAKGLEAKRVFILLPENASMPHPMAKSTWQKEQEVNLKYVAITRAIEELIWVS